MLRELLTFALRVEDFPVSCGTWMTPVLTTVQHSCLKSKNYEALRFLFYPATPLLSTSFFTHQDLPLPYCSVQTVNSTCTETGYGGTHLWPQWSGSRFGHIIRWRLGGPQSWSGRFGEENNLLSRIEPRILGLAALTLDTWLTTDNLAASCTGPRSKMGVYCPAVFVLLHNWG